jgi:hypothetical protein
MKENKNDNQNVKNQNENNKKLNIDKKVLRGYEFLYKFNQNNKFSIKNNRNFIHLYLLYLQNTYRFNFDFKDYSKSKLFYKCLNSLYEKLGKTKAKSYLFTNKEIIGDILFIDKKFSIEDFLTQLEEKTYSLNFVRTNIQFLDYLGNTDNDVEIVNCGFCLLLFNERYPNISVNKKLVRNIVDNLIKCAKPINDNITYINSQAVLLLLLLRKIDKFKDLDSYIKLLYSSQKDNGSWNNGYSTYLISNSNDLDILHTSIALINLM